MKSKQKIVTHTNASRQQLRWKLIDRENANYGYANMIYFIVNNLDPQDDEKKFIWAIIKFYYF